MSHFNFFNTEVTDEECLVKALRHCTNPRGVYFNETTIERHATPQNLFGYRGDMREQQAHVIIRKENVGQLANDLGFIRDKDGKYQAIISDFDSNYYDKKWLGKLITKYNHEKTKATLRERKISFEEVFDKKGRRQIIAEIPEQNKVRF
jgi:hypothetical protein